MSQATVNTLIFLRIIDSRDQRVGLSQNEAARNYGKYFQRLNFPLNFMTGPLIAVLFLLAIGAIGRNEVRGGTVGADGISPLDIMIFFLSLAYIALSIDASGLIRYLALKVLTRGGTGGIRLFGYLYAFFFALTAFVGNDPVILSGTAFLAYMTRASSNITSPRAWIYSQFAVANIASAILVSSNPTNLVIAGAFNIKFIKYTANAIVPVIVTGLVLLPFLLLVVFRRNSLIPRSIELHELPDEAKGKPPRNPHIRTRQSPEEQDSNLQKELPLEEIMNPYLDKASAWFGTILMAATLAIVLAVNAVIQGKVEVQVYWITLPAAAIMLSWDIGLGWSRRHESRRLARTGNNGSASIFPAADKPLRGQDNVEGTLAIHETAEAAVANNISREDQRHQKATPTESVTLASQVRRARRWCHETFPTATAVLTHVPFALVPFALCMFVLVQGLVTTGWVPVFANGWDRWVQKTGTVGAVGGMGFLSVVLSNFTGTNIGTSILLSRVVQSWEVISHVRGGVITERTFWATIYSMVIGVNYGAFSVAFSASLAGLLWRDILQQKHIHVRSRDFVRINLPIIAMSMIVGCAVLLGQVYITRGTTPHRS